MNMSPPFHFSTHILLKSYNIHDLLFTHVFIYKRRAVCRNEPHGRSSLTHSTHDMSPQKTEVLSSLTTLFWKKTETNPTPRSRTYEGEYKDGNFHGRGTRTYASGNVYEGEFKDGQRHGRGTFKWSNGDVYAVSYTHLTLPTKA